MPEPYISIEDLDFHDHNAPIPQSPREFALPGTEWLPKTDWSRDRIIANDD